MTWFSKYWILKKKYDLLLKQYNDLVDLLDKDFWNDIDKKGEI